MEGLKNTKIRKMTELIMQKSIEKIESHSIKSLSIDQYNSIFNSVQEVLKDNI